MPLNDCTSFFGARGWHLVYSGDLVLGWFVAICSVYLPIEVDFCALVLQFFVVEFDIAFSCCL